MWTANDIKLAYYSDPSRSHPSIICSAFSVFNRVSKSFESFNNHFGLRPRHYLEFVFGHLVAPLLLPKSGSQCRPMCPSLSPADWLWLFIDNKLHEEVPSFSLQDALPRYNQDGSDRIAAVVYLRKQGPSNQSRAGGYQLW